MNYGRIRRGPMAADAFTQIRNAVFRDPRLSAKAMGIFGNISTHRDGWGITPESISTQMRDGVDSIKAGLRELERCGYLQRIRERRPDGTLGASVYFITDQPELVAAARGQETPSSEPEGDFPPVAQPTQVEPPEAKPALENPPHKKTNSKNPKGQKTTLPPLPPPPADQPTAPASGREGGRELTPEQQQAADTLARITESEPRLMIGEVELARLAPLVVPWLDRASPEQLRQALTAGLPPEIDSPAGLLRRRLLEKLPPPRKPAPAKPGLPPCCPRCAEENPAAKVNPRLRYLDDGTKCPDCHPDQVATAA